MPQRPLSPTAGLSGLRLDELLKEVQDRLTEIVKTRDRLQGLLDAVIAVGAGLELDSTLQRIVQAAVQLVDARYGALGVRPAWGGDRSSSMSVSVPSSGSSWVTCPKGAACWEC
jgi:hypothetical protein